MSKTKVALLGDGFIADIHLESYRRFVPDAEVVAVYSRTRGRAEAFAKQHGIPKACDDLEQELARTGQKVKLPFASKAAKPIDHWLGGK